MGFSNPRKLSFLLLCIAMFSVHSSAFCWYREGQIRKLGFASSHVFLPSSNNKYQPKEFTRAELRNQQFTDSLLNLRSTTQQSSRAKSNTIDISSNSVDSYMYAEEQNEITNIRRPATFPTLVREVEFSENVSDMCPCSTKWRSSDSFVDCTHLNLDHINSTWFPENTTVLFLDYNDLITVPNYVFSHLRSLQYLSICNNHLQYLHSDSFQGLENLKILSLEFNLLSFNERTFPVGVFSPLSNLRELRLLMNEGGNLYHDSYPKHLFSDLQHLELLSIDTVGDILDLPEDLAKCRNLTVLEISGNVINITSSSFKNVPHVKKLILNSFPSLSNASEMALQYFHDLHDFSLSNVYIGTEQSLRILKPLQGKNMTSIHYSCVSPTDTDASPSIGSLDGEIDSYKAEYLRHICVKDFLLEHAFVFLITYSAFHSDVWKKCLKSFSIPLNNLIGSKTSFFYILSAVEHLEEFYVYDCLRECIDGSKFITEESRLQHKQKHRFLVSENSESIAEFSRHNEMLTKTAVRGSEVTQSSNSYKRCFTDERYSDAQLYGYFRVYLTPNLKNVNIRRWIASQGIGSNLYFVNTSLMYLDVSDSGLFDFTGSILGLDQLQILVLSGNRVGAPSATFLDGFCNLEEFHCSSCQFDSDLFLRQSSRLFQNLTQLKILDISSNYLTMLSPDTFAPNRNIKYLNIAQNRFQSVPFNLKFTPKLKWLDLRHNSITSFDAETISQLEDLAKNPEGFFLFLSGNILSCGCNNIHFLQWLRTTQVRLDNDGNYTCMTTDGQLSYLAAYTDLVELWRHCVGESVFYVSLILFSFIIIGHLCFLFVWKNKTLIKSTLARVLLGHKLKVASDYKIGVFIGYTEADYVFPCFVLDKFIRETLHLSTYLCHRDEIIGNSVASCIMEAINDSWRIVLVFNENFLRNDEWLVYTYRCAMYSQTPANPSRVVVLVEENLQLELLPSEVLSGVAEDNVVVIPGWQMSYEAKEQLRTRLKDI